jgi:hypothetical protein
LRERPHRISNWQEALMSDKEGILRIQPSGCWTVCRPGHNPVEIASGELFRLEVGGELTVTRMEYSTWEGGYYCGFPLCDGLHAAIGKEG